MSTVDPNRPRLPLNPAVVVALIAAIVIVVVLVGW